MFISCSVFGCHSDTVPVVCLVATICISNLFVESFYHSRLDDNYKEHLLLSQLYNYAKCPLFGGSTVTVVATHTLL